MASTDRPGFHPAAGRPGLDVRRPGAGHRRAGGALCALLPEPEGQRPPLLLLPAAVHGRHAGHGALGQPAPADDLLGTHQHQFVPADRLLVAPPGCPRRRTHGAGDHRRRRPGTAGRRAADRPHRRQFRSRRGVGRRRTAPRQRVVPVRAVPRACRHFHQERAVPVPLLAAARDGCAHAGVGLSAFGHHGESRCVPAGTPASGPGGHGPVLLHGQWHRRGHPADRRLERDFPA